MRIDPDVKLDFCDVLIKPQWSKAPSRSSVRLDREFTFKKCSWNGIPIIAANLDTVGTFSMAKAMAEHGMMTCLHKHYQLDQLVEFFRTAPKGCFYTLGIKTEDMQKLDDFSKRVDVLPFLCVDVANAHIQFAAERIKMVRDKYPNAVLMAGNVVTPELVHHLVINGGVDIVKIGIGSGSCCTTRLISGCGYPQLSAVIECADAAHGCGAKICSDGGVTCPGDVAKAFAAGADFVMVGGLLAGHDECDGERSDGKFKFYGMSSLEANRKYSGGLKGYRAAEGRCIEVPCKGPVSATLQEIAGGLSSAATYLGASKLKDFPKCCTFIRVNRTHNSVFESWIG
ncbi:MAG TPA: GMP reductase [Planctomycetota bacterium]|jgi:GMP reductase